MIKVGITGSIGSGKSAVGRILVENSYPVLDADLLVHQLYASHIGLRNAIANRFGASYLLPEGIDRPAMQALILKDSQARTDLESLVYPILEEHQNKWFQKQKDTHKIAFVEAALLYKLPDFVKTLSAIWVVQAPEEIRLQRLQMRGLSKSDALSLIKLQKNQKPVEHPHIECIQNDFSIEILKNNIENKIKNLIFKP